MNNVEFLWGENLSDTTPVVNQGQILFDKTTSTLHIDTDSLVVFLVPLPPLITFICCPVLVV